MKSLILIPLLMLPLWADEIIIKPVDGDGEAVKVDVSVPAVVEIGGKKYSIEPAKKSATQLKAESIVLPSINFESVSIDQAMFFIQFRSAELDKDGVEDRGINYLIAGDSDVEIDELRLKNVTIYDALKAISLKTGVRVEYGPKVITLHSKP